MPFPVAGDGGGSVSNALPSVKLLESSAATFSEGAVGILTGTVKDPNKASDIQEVRMLVVTGPVALTVTHAVTGAERAATSEPASFGADGFKVWKVTGAASNGDMSDLDDDDDNDGDEEDGEGHSANRLKVKFQYTFATPGTYTWRLLVRDEITTFQFDANKDVAVTAVTRILVGADPVSDTGATLASTAWGSWQALPGATNVVSQNYIKVVNTGLATAQRMLLDFSPTSFAGLTDASDRIPLDGNVQFAWWEDATPTTTSPTEAGSTYTYGATSPDGSVAPTFSGIGNVIYVKYRILGIPDVIADQSFQAAYTVTPL